MTIRRLKEVIVGTILLSFSILIVTVIPAQAIIKLDLHHWGSPGEAHVVTFNKWAKDLEEKSGGRVKVTVTCGAALGKGSDYYDFARKGIADIASVAFPYTPGQFPLAEVFGLPVNAPSAELASKAFFELYKKGLYDKQLDEVKVLFIWCTAPYQLLWTKSPATALTDFKGRKIRVAGGTHTPAIKALGGIPVFMPMAEVYLAMEKGIVDGALIPIGIVKPLAFQEVSKYVTKIDTFFFPMALVMNKKVYEGLPKDIQKTIDEMVNNAEEYSIHSGKGQDVWDVTSWNILKTKGIRIDILNDSDAKEMRRLLKPIIDKWVSDNEGKGLPAKKTVEELKLIFKSLGVSEPFVY